MKKVRFKINQKDNRITFWLNPKIYPLPTIHSAAYVFVDRAYVSLDKDSAQKIGVSLEGKEKLTKPRLTNLKGEFLNEHLKNLVRESVFKKNKKILEYIVGGAITAALEKPLLAEESQDKEMLEIEKEIAVLQKELEKETFQDCEDDFLEIAKPYEKRHQKSQ